MIRVTTIGSGTVAPSPTRVSAAHLVEVDDLCILLDCGSGAVHRMASLGIDWMRITHVLVTHFHSDHISDIASLLFAWRYGALPPRSAAAWLGGPPGFGRIFATLNSLYDNDLDTLDFPLHVSEIEPDTQMQLTSGVRLSAMRVPHTDASIAYAIESGGRRIVYTGDTPCDPSLAQWSSGCDLLITECSLPSELAVASHMTPEQCAGFAALANPRALAIAHFYPSLIPEEAGRIIATRYAGPVHLAYDGWTYQLED